MPLTALDDPPASLAPGVAADCPRRNQLIFLPLAPTKPSQPAKCLGAREGTAFPSWHFPEQGSPDRAAWRANARLPLFQKDGDYVAFEKVLTEAQQQVPMPLLAYCILPNHWHLLVWPQQEKTLSRFLNWLTLTHTQRWQAHYHSTGTGHLYQGRFKSFPVASDEHFLTVCHYVERNPLRSGLERRAEDWRWSSLWRRSQGWPEARGLLGLWPVPEPADWRKWVNKPQTEAELGALRQSVQRGRPFGTEAWVKDTAERLGLQATLHPLGRPRKGQVEIGS